MRLSLSSRPARWFAGIGFAALMLAGLACRAGNVETLAPLSLAKPDPAIRDRIVAYETGTARRSLSDPLPFEGPDGRPVYLFIAGCCDQFNPLYDADGRFICAPTGGFAGSGDGRCPAWVYARFRPRPADLAGSNPSRVAESR